MIRSALVENKTSSTKAFLIMWHKTIIRHFCDASKNKKSGSQDEIWRTIRGHKICFNAKTGEIIKGNTEILGGHTNFHEFLKSFEIPKAEQKGLVSVRNLKELPAHIQAGKKIPPNWKNVHVATDPKNKYQVSGYDTKGRLQTWYSEEFQKQQAIKKFSNVRSLQKKIGELKTKLSELSLDTDPNVADTADCLHLVATMGVRPDSNANTGAKGDHYGATTLEARHVVVDGDKVSLDFIGKEGVHQLHEVTDPAIKKMLVERKNGKADDAPLFPNATASRLSKMIKDVAGKQYKTKDLRTALACTIAKQEVDKIKEIPASINERKKLINKIAEKVSSHLGNKPKMALNNYIDPSVFAKFGV